MCQESYLIFLQEHCFLKRILDCLIGYLPFKSKMVLFKGLFHGILLWCIGYCTCCIRWLQIEKHANMVQYRNIA